ncbi:MAG: hypothetical protein V4457_11750 [Pseudomonadota bacterium]
MRREPNTLLPGVVLLTCLAALYVAWRTVNRYEAAANDSIRCQH